MRVDDAAGIPTDEREQAYKPPFQRDLAAKKAEAMRGKALRDGHAA